MRTKVIIVYEPNFIIFLMGKNAISYRKFIDCKIWLIYEMMLENVLAKWFLLNCFIDYLVINI